MAAYAVATFLGAFLLFQVQPLIARLILPWFGGTPAVWTTCMLFFQIVLLGGYLYAHLVVSKLRPRSQAVAQIAVLVVSVGALVAMKAVWGTPIMPPATWAPPDASLPVLRILAILAVAVGLPYFTLSTTSPLLQGWFSRTHVGRSPYRLYSLSNIGSLLALLSYPVVVEPWLDQRAQSTVWSVAFAAFAAVVITCAVLLWRKNPASLAIADDPEAASEPDETITAWRKLLWIALPAAASALFLATTNQLTEDIAVVPFLWILPLGLYLLSFIICFDKDQWYSRAWYVTALAVAVPGMVYVMYLGLDLPIMRQMAAYLAALFICCMVCHGELVKLKPHAKHLTSFYLAVAFGGALGGVFVAIVAPHVFKGFWEMNISLAFCALVGAAVVWKHSSLWRPLGKPLTAVFALAAVAALLIPWYNSRELSTVPGTKERNFYGILQVDDIKGDRAGGELYALRHGRITHGWEFLDKKYQRVPTSYFGPHSGVGLALRNDPRLRSPNPAQRHLRIGVVGLGAGTLAVYANKGDYLRFYEINPAVAELSGPGGCFTYLRDCPARVSVVLGDGRISLERELKQGHPQRFDVLVLDAFSSDSVPVHLLTEQAFKMYLKQLRDRDSILAVQVTNRALDLRPVVYKVAATLGLSAVYIEDRDPPGLTCWSDWMLLCRNPKVLEYPGIARYTKTPTNMPTNVGLWTDDYHNLFQIIRWRH